MSGPQVPVMPLPFRSRVAVIYDTTAGLLSRLWRLGVAVDQIPYAVGVAELDPFDAAVRALTAKGVLEFHYWGHGAPGRPKVGGRTISPYSLPYHTVWWWRVCSLMAGDLGREFALAAAQCGITTVGHTVKISTPVPWRQRRICALRAGERVWWPEDGKGLRGCSTFRMQIPPWAFREGAGL